MTVCRFYLQGNCKFGDQCRNEHPSRSNSGPTRNPFAPLQNSSNSRTSTGGGRSNHNRDTNTSTYGLTKNGISNDLLNERPQWLLSAYGPGRDAPKQLFGGFPREQSFEELRVRHYELGSQGRHQEAIQEVKMLLRVADDQNKNALRDLDGAIKYVIDGENVHPNRFDVCEAKGNLVSQTDTTGNLAQMASGGQLAAQTDFSQPSTNTFGKPSSQGATFARPGGATFGQPSQPQSSVFGQPTGTFGQPTSTFGQPSAPQGLFGVTKQTAAPSQQNNNSFAAPNQATNLSPNVSQSGAFGAAAPTSTAGTFNPQPATDSRYPNQNVGRESSPFFATANSTNTSTTQNPFSRNTAGQQGLGSFTGGQSGIQAANANMQKESNGRLRAWNGRSVTYLEDEPCYRSDDGNWRRIWFPDGAPRLVNSQELPDDLYDNVVRGSYEHLARHGEFKEGFMPLVPPKREWCNWNL